jgi:hypothetical protein
MTLLTLGHEASSNSTIARRNRKDASDYTIRFTDGRSDARSCFFDCYELFDD